MQWAIDGEIDAVIIDLDGTMVDTMGDFVAAINLMLGDLPLPDDSLPLDAATANRMVGKGSEHLVRSVLAHVQEQMPPAQNAVDVLAHYDFAFDHYQAHYAAVNGQHSALYPGVLEGLRGLHGAGLPLVCLTNKPVAFARALLARKGLDGFFGTVFGGDSFERKKPDPLPLLKTCALLGTTPARTLMIGDSSNDSQAARAAGCPVLLVTYGYNHGEPVQAVDADGLIDSLTQVRWPQ
ncbi:phosphoglycolate phosphatase [Polaromonas sp.]|jgi:phosphoglycolate phosphatase|uniref:phosphoglycolate phosphatase n=1 Tax=Polaromonas sp. TaxID=1869339 RepID=UPI001E0D8A0F|nr:phosphoglycolate phosphatase [Polaromonas sp.]MBT9475815.1 phosphoglycolate phosphatase [Polaromonas sp.]